MASKYRYWACSLYPLDDINDLLLTVDDVKKYYVHKLNELHCDFVLSPLHNPDALSLYDSEGNLDHVKPHFHLLVLWNGPTTYNTIAELLDIFHHCSRPIPVYQVNGYIRYLIHLDNPDKEQFSGQDALTLIGNPHDTVQEAFDIGDYDKVKICKDMASFILDNGISELTDLLIYASNNEPKWAYILYKNVPNVITQLLSSVRYQFRNNR